MRLSAGMTIATTTIAALTVGAPAATATLPGKRGPIAFQRLLDPRDEQSGQIFRVGPAGRRPHQLTKLEGGAFAPDFSPDGRMIAFERRTLDGSPDSVFTMRADGSRAARVPLSCEGECLGEGEPTWRPDGDLTFVRAFGPIVDDNAAELDITLARVDGANETVLRRFGSEDGNEPHSNEWSPNGRLIAVTLLNTTAQPKGGSAIYLLDASGNDVRRITPFRLNAGNPDWSPDGKRIVFNSSYEGQGRVELYTVRPDGSGLRRVRREKKSFSFEPVWSPDGRRIAFVHGGAKPPHIWTMRPDGTKMRQETHGPLPDFAPDWGSSR
jgi:TolB protein